MRAVICLLAVALLTGGFPLSGGAKSYSSGGGHSYSSSSHSSSSPHSSSSGGSHSFSSGSHSFSSGSSPSSSSGPSHSSSSSGSSAGASHSSSSSKDFTSSSGHSYSSGSTWSDNGRHSYTSGKSYTSGSGISFASSSHKEDMAPMPTPSRKAEPVSVPSSFAFDTAAAHARKEEASKTKFTQFKESQPVTPSRPNVAEPPAADTPWSDSGGHSYTSGKSYTSGSGISFASSSHKEDMAPVPTPSRKAEPVSAPNSFAFDTAAAHARKEEASETKFTQFKESQQVTPGRPNIAEPPVAYTPSYRVKPPPLPASDTRSYRARVYVPDVTVISTRPARIYNVFNPYSSRPWVVYNDPYNSLFWWWLLDRSLDDRAWWAYHHRYDMDPARYQALVATDQQLEARVEQLETQQAPRDPNYVPAGLDQDLMYSDRYVAQTYSNRPTTGGVIAFWVLGIPIALAVTGFFIWLIWFKRWQTAT